MKRIDITGKRFGSLIAMECVKRDRGHSYWLCKCDCGGPSTVVTLNNLRRKHTTSCGCLKFEWGLKEGNHRWVGGPSVAGYDAYTPLLSFAEEVRRDPENKKAIQVKCSLCKNWFSPSQQQAQHRKKGLYDILTPGVSEGRFYCGDECKGACIIFNKKKYREGESPYYDRPNQSQWRDLVLTHDNNECQLCGATKELHAHHFEGIELNPVESADVDNGITLCKKCHIIVHNQEGCKPYDLTRQTC